MHNIVYYLSEKDEKENVIKLPSTWRHYCSNSFNSLRIHHAGPSVR
jgi:hypothetical protein